MSDLAALVPMAHVASVPRAVAFYEKLGFEALATVGGELGDRPVPRPMFLELGALPKRDR